MCGFNHRVTLLREAAGAWAHEVVYVGNDRMKIAAIDDVLEDREGLEVVVAGSDGRVVLLHERPLGWARRGFSDARPKKRPPKSESTPESTPRRSRAFSVRTSLRQDAWTTRLHGA